MSSAAVINTFLGHIFTGRMDEALALVAPDARFIPSRPEPTAAVPLFGTYVGPEGARRVFTTFVEVLEPGRFEVEGTLEQGELVTLFGQLEHMVRATGKPFRSDWAMVCKVVDGKVALYHFYEDTLALGEALAG